MEVALVLPVVLAVALLAVQVALVARDQVAVTHAARVAAREAAVDPRQSSVEAAAARSATALKPSQLTTETSHQGGPNNLVIVRVRYLAPTDVPLVGPLLPDIPLEAVAAMRDETGQQQ